MNKLLQAGVLVEASGWRFLPTIELKVAGHKSETIYFFLSEIIFCENMVHFQKNDGFNNDKIFLCNIWHSP